MLNKAIYDPHHTHIGLVRPGSAPAGTCPPTHKPTHLTPRGHAGGRERWGRRGAAEAVPWRARRENPNPLSSRSKNWFAARDLDQLTVLLDVGQNSPSWSKHSGPAGHDMP